jgi:hypothetical protein
MNIWIEINKLTSQTLRTLDQRKPFDVVEVTEHAVIVCPHKSEINRQISRDALVLLRNVRQLCKNCIVSDNLGNLK